MRTGLVGGEAIIAGVRRVALAAAVTAVGLVGVAQAQSPTREEAYGARVAKRNCAQCHAIGERGDSPNPKSPRFRDLHKKYALEDLQMMTLKQLMSQHEDMPQFRLSQEELTGLIAYLQAIQYDKTASADEPAVRF